MAIFSPLSVWRVVNARGTCKLFSLLTERSTRNTWLVSTGNQFSAKMADIDEDDFGMMESKVEIAGLVRSCYMVD